MIATKLQGQEVLGFHIPIMDVVVEDGVMWEFLTNERRKFRRKHIGQTLSTVRDQLKGCFIPVFRNEVPFLQN